MRINYFKSLLFFLFLLFQNNVGAQLYSPGDIISDIYYGAPNTRKMKLDYFSEIFPSGGAIVHYGPMGLRGEYLLTNRVGIGVDFIYDRSVGRYLVDSLNTDGTLYETYELRLIHQRFRFQIHVNYHFYTTEKLDLYTGFGSGSNYRVFSARSSELSKDHFTEGFAISPFSFRWAIGFRYFLLPNLGLQTEFGIGGPLFSLGLTGRF